MVQFCKSLWSLAAFVSLLSSSLLPEPNSSANFDIFAFLHSCLLPILSGQIAFWFCPDSQNITENSCSFYSLLWPERVKISSQLLFSLKIEENQLRKLTILSKKKNLQKRICNLCLLAAGQPEPSSSANFCFPCSRNTAFAAAAGR